jgi:hypothetical protein
MGVGRAGHGDVVGRRPGDDSTGGASRAGTHSSARWPPPRFAAYIATSARCSRASGVSSPGSPTATPMLAEAVSRRSPTRNGSASAQADRSEQDHGRAGDLVHGREPGGQGGDRDDQGRPVDSAERHEDPPEDRSAHAGPFGGYR